MFKKKNILFIIPPYLAVEKYQDKSSEAKVSVLTLPYGLLSIISYCNSQNEFNFKVLDLNKVILEDLKGDLKKNTLKSVINTIKNFNPEYIGISALFNNAFSYLKFIIPEMRKQVSDKFICLGGGLGTTLYKEIFEDIPELDAICYGEGEKPFKELLDNDSTSSDAWITKEKLKKGFTPKHDFIENLDDLPMIDYSYMPYFEYNSRSLLDKEENSNKTELYIHTSRGCPFNCVFCANGEIHGKKIRMMSSEKVIETILYYKKTYNS